MDHAYTAKYEGKKTHDRTGSVFFTDHFYCKSQVSPTGKAKRKHDALTPTGLTPTLPAKIGVHSDRKSLWTTEEKHFFKLYVQSNARTSESLNYYWQRCAEEMNIYFPEHYRNGMFTII